MAVIGLNITVYMKCLCALSVCLWWHY